MLIITIDKSGETASSVRMRGSVRDIIAESFMAIEAVYASIDDKDHEDADLFKLMFYKAAKERKFFNDDDVCKAIKIKADKSGDKKTPEQELREWLIGRGISDTTADMLVKAAKGLSDLLNMAAKEAGEDND